MDQVQVLAPTATRVNRRRSHPAIGAVWSTSLHSFCANGRFILPVAVLGIGSVLVLTAITLSTLAAGRCTAALAALCQSTEVRWGLVVAQAVAIAVAQVCIVRTLCTGRVQWPTLLAGSVVYTLLYLLGWAAVQAPVNDLQQAFSASIHTATINRRSTEFDAVSWAAITSTVKSVLPDPGVTLPLLLGVIDPLDYHPPLPQACAGHNSAWPVVNSDRWSEYAATHCDQPARLDGVALILLLALLLVAEIALRFKVVGAVATKGSARLFAPLIASARLSLRHFGAVAAHVWVLKFAGAAAWIVLCQLPMLIFQQLAVPRISPYIHSYVDLTSLRAVVTLLCLAAISGVAIAFTTVYDMALFDALQT